MDDDDNLSAGPILGNETLLLWVAVGLAIVFLGLLAFDLIKRRKRDRWRRRHGPKGLRAKLLGPVHRAQALRSDLEQLLHERSHHKDREPRPPPQTPP